MSLGAALVWMGSFVGGPENIDKVQVWAETGSLGAARIRDGMGG